MSVIYPVTAVGKVMILGYPQGKVMTLGYRVVLWGLISVVVKAVDCC